MDTSYEREQDAGMGPMTEEQKAFVASQMRQFHPTAEWLAQQARLQANAYRWRTVHPTMHEIPAPRIPLHRRFLRWLGLGDPV
jgi:hypothetical protein